MQITITTAGTRGDVQPYIALGRGLQQAGHTVRLAAPPRFQAFITNWELDFTPLNYVDYSEEHSEDDEPSEASLRQKITQATVDRFQPILGELLNYTELIPDPTAIIQNYAYRLRSPQDSFLPELNQTCQEAEAIIFAPHLFPIYDVVKKLGVPCFAACVHPLHGTHLFPHPYAPTYLRVGSAYQSVRIPLRRIYNQLTYHFFDHFLWQAIRQPVNQWHQSTLQLPPISQWASPLRRMHQQRVPFLYGYSPSILPRPANWPNWLH